MLIVVVTHSAVEFNQSSEGIRLIEYSSTIIATEAMSALKSSLLAYEQKEIYSAGLDELRSGEYYGGK